MTERMAQFSAALAALPIGTVTGLSREKRYIATKFIFNNGRSSKLVAEELGGSDYISLNFYDLKRGAQLFPCEMSRDKVIAFILDFQPDQPAGA